MFFISFSRILPLDEFFYEAKSFQILQNQYKFSMILFRIMENWRFDMNLLCLKWFCFIENLIEWQNSWKAYKKQTLILYFKILQNNFYINAFSINFLVNVNWGGGSAKCQRLSTRGEGGRKFRKSCQRSLRMAPFIE